MEDIPSVKKSLQQATCQASKLLLPSMHDYKRLEVSDGEDGESTPQAVTIITLCVCLRQNLSKSCLIFLVGLVAPILIAFIFKLCQSVGFYCPVDGHGDGHHPSSISQGQVCHLWESRRQRRSGEVSLIQIYLNNILFPLVMTGNAGMTLLFRLIRHRCKSVALTY